MTPEEIFFQELPEDITTAFEIRIVERPDYWRAKQLQAFAKDQYHTRFSTCWCACHKPPNPIIGMLFDSKNTHPDTGSPDFQAWVTKCREYLASADEQITG